MSKSHEEQMEYLRQLNEWINRDEVDYYVSGSYLRHVQLYGDKLDDIEELPLTENKKVKY